MYGLQTVMSLISIGCEDMKKVWAFKTFDEQFTCFWEIRYSKERVINIIKKGGKNFFLPYSKEGASLEKFAE